ncbi:MAG TPA: twin-arginine translocase subunit TatC [Flavisolibacter sp.]|nr:twin-arginine translocase subunit TatC [Flavisolibacter sp.]
MALSIFKRKRGEEQAEMSFIDHLEVLRGHLFRSVVAIAIGAIVAGIFNKFIIKQVLLGPTHDSFPTYGVICKIGKSLNLGNALCMEGIDLKMQSTIVSGQFSMWFTVILVSGLIIAFPYVFAQFWDFIKPALTKKELNRTRGVIFWVSFLFFTGVAFGYFVVAPYALNFFFHFQLDEIIENRWTINSYIDMMLPLVLGSGLAFQLPLVIFFLAKIGLVTAVYLSKARKYAVVIIFIVAGIITPGPDVISQLAVALPLMLLYEISIILARRVDKERAEEDAKEWS